MGEKTSKTIQQNRCQFLVTELLFTDYMKIVLWTWNVWNWRLVDVCLLRGYVLFRSFVTWKRYHCKWIRACWCSVYPIQKSSSPQVTGVAVWKNGSIILLSYLYPSQTIIVMLQHLATSQISRNIQIKLDKYINVPSILKMAHTCPNTNK